MISVSSPVPDERPHSPAAEPEVTPTPAAGSKGAAADSPAAANPTILSALTGGEPAAAPASSASTQPAPSAIPSTSTALPLQPPPSKKEVFPFYTLCQRMV